MKMAVHLDPYNKKVLGVWMNQDGQLYSYYTGTLYELSLGKRTHDIRKPDRRTVEYWDAWCDYLSEQVPNDAWWESEEALPDETPEQAYERLTEIPDKT